MYPLHWDNVVPMELKEHKLNKNFVCGKGKNILFENENINNSWEIYEIQSI